MKRIFYIGGAIVSIVFLMFIYYGNLLESVSIGNFSFKRLDVDIINKYSNAKNEEKNDVENNIKDIVLRDMNMDEWNKYLEDIKLGIYEFDIVGDKEKEILISLNLSKNLSVVGIYELKGDDYLLYSKIENLNDVEKIEVKEHKATGQKLLILEEFLDERIGAYFTDRFTRIFVETEKRFEEVFRQSKDYEAYYYEKWIDPSKESSKWYKLNESNKVEYDLKNSKGAIITVSRDLKKSQGVDGTASKIPSQFKEVEKKNFDIKYLWNEEYRTFIIGRGKMITTGEEVAILEDTSKTIDYLLNLGDKYYKVINKNMKIKHIKEEEINIEKLKINRM